MPSERRARASSVSSALSADLKSPRSKQLRRAPDTAQAAQSEDDLGSQLHSDEHASQAAAEDVCFPMDEDHKSTGPIDFQEMQDFVVQQKLRQGSISSSTRSRKYSVISTARGPYLEHVSSRPQEPAVTDDDDEDDDDSSLGEKSKLPRTFSGRDRASVRPPDKFSFFCSQMDGTIHATEFGDLLQDDQTFNQLFDAGQGVWWLDVLDPSDIEMKMIAKAFSIHPLTAEDIRVQEQREKVELFDRYYFVCFRSFQPDSRHQDFLEPVNKYMVVFREGLISFHFTPNPHSASVRRRVRQLRDYVDISSDWICYALIDDIVDSFGPLIHNIEGETDAIEDAVLIARTDESREMLRHIGECRKKVMRLLRLLGGKADVIKMFAKRCNEHWDVAPKGEIGLYLGDIQDHIITMTSTLKEFEQILSRSHSNYLAQLSVDAVQGNNRINYVLSKITVIGTILVPMNLITGLFGMNVHVPGQGKETYTWFFGVAGSIVLFWIIAMFFARRWRII
ncbi:putative metal ion transporter [Neolecta irregularis DAH-3]|uniref:Putative metal ion transporter n=1 Tax=Neolecta irregularis (strain DAH-3) TaxID=1198029 RepID=A0A1U7LJN4_NEOID|nr:putative metal ion transporter [Neolecta irregularis DAH-3]|eukprot:OLL22876.1 putative metal ion transporter [Neolecta irregularis DAH-3]